MQAIIWGLTMPVIPFLLRRLYAKEDEGRKTALLRYGAYVLSITVLTTLSMVFLCEENTSFMDKIDSSPAFAVKYLLLALAASLFTAAADWVLETRKVSFHIARQEFREATFTRYITKGLMPDGVFLLAMVVVLVNSTMIFDNVLWGDEAFSANLVRHNIPDMMQIITLEDSHPPLYYLWLKLCTVVLGHSGTVYHLASLLPFMAGIVLVLTIVRKRAGNIPAAFFVMLSGLGASCMEYNVEVRMYSLAFLLLAFCYYCAWSVVRENKIIAWTGLVLWGLAGAYTHYYAVPAFLIMLVLTGFAACLRFGGKTWLKALVCGLVFVVGYLPWAGVLIDNMKQEGNWWMTQTASIKECLTMMLGGEGMSRLLLPFLILALVLFLAVESSVFRLKKGEKLEVGIHFPRMDVWSADLYVLLIGFFTIGGTLIAGKLASVLISPILARRYMYPFTGIAAIMLVVASGHLLKLLKDLAGHLKKHWPVTVGKTVLVALLAGMCLAGFRDYGVISQETGFQEEKTQEVLSLIGEPVEGMTLVNNGISHIGWTVLRYYYPDAEILNTTFDSVESDDFWYFTPAMMSQEQLDLLAGKGYVLAGYGEKQLVKYPFILYHFYKE